MTVVAQLAIRAVERKNVLRPQISSSSNNIRFKMIKIPNKSKESMPWTLLGKNSRGERQNN